MRDPKISYLLFMALVAACLVVDIEGPSTVVAVAAELTLGDLAHVHLIRILGHLERMVMTGTALVFLPVYMHCVTE